MAFEVLLSLQRDHVQLANRLLGVRLWPVLASFDTSHSGLSNRLEFNCAGRQSSFALVSEKRDLR